MTTSMIMKKLPSNVVKYSQVPSISKPPFTATTIPKGLLKEHNTKAGTWGVIRVLKGKLLYQINHQRSDNYYDADGNDANNASSSLSSSSSSTTTATMFQYVLDVDTAGIIEPQVFHQVAPITEDLEFVVEFYRHPTNTATTTTEPIKEM